MKSERVIILKKVAYGESDLIVHGLNTQGARMHFIAKGAKRSKKRFGGGLLEPTQYIKVQFKERKYSDSESALHFLHEAQIIDGFDGLRTCYDRLETGLYFVQLVSKVIQEGVLEEDSIFNLLGHALRQAEKTDRLDILKMQFELKFLFQQGVLPPDLSYAPVLSRSILEHEALEIEEGQLRSLQSMIQHFLASYIG